MKFILTTTLIFAITTCLAQAVSVYPTNWWVGMQYNKVQLLIHSNTNNNIMLNKTAVSINYPGIKALKVTSLPNRKYLIVDISIAPNCKPGTFNIVVNNANPANKIVIPYQLKPRRQGNGTSFAQGITNKDFMYLIMPDRFSNGDPTNDRIPGMLDQTLNRDTVFNRHGGDLKGIENHLDYLKNLGVTAIWLTPVIENNMPDRTEHGYAFTDHYTIERRLGGENAYQSLIDESHKKGFKFLQDAVYNHIGSEHILFKDKPAEDWFHVWPKYTNTNYKDQTIFDPYATTADKKVMTNGWFVPTMPDWNHDNILVANFLIQHAIWSVENFGFDGWRIDTYSYNDLTFMNRCNQALYNEYPKITLFGETWVHGVPNQSYFCQNNYNIPFKSNLQATTDFQTLFYGIQPALTQDFGWTDGVNKLYTTLAQDFVYKDPTRQVIFFDNHDIARFYSVLDKNLTKYKSAWAWLLTCRGIPQAYYGSEILMEGFTNPDGNVRKDFAGGWPNDPKNKFTPQGRSEQENDMVNYITTLANFRKNSQALTTGAFKQVTPVDGLYVYARYTNNETVLCVMNTSKTTKNINFVDYQELIKSYKTGLLINGNNKPINFSQNYALGTYETLVIQCKQ